VQNIHKTLYNRPEPPISYCRNEWRRVCLFVEKNLSWRADVKEQKALLEQIAKISDWQQGAHRVIKYRFYVNFVGYFSAFYS